jgi:peptide/nickel transport system substrate-binding protein
LTSAAIAALLLVALLALAGCGTASKTADNSATSDSPKKDTLTIAIAGETSNIDPAYCYDDENNPVADQITETLLYYDAENQLQPGLVEKWEAVDDTTYVYDLRQNVTFSDGTPLTVEDVLYSLERYRDPDIASYVGWMYDNVDTMEKTGDWQFTVKLKAADATWEHIFASSAGMVTQKAFCESAGDQFGKPGTGTLGTGPYKLSDWKTGSQIVLEYNENYWNKAAIGDPQIKKVVFQFIEEDSTRVMALTSGQVDVIFSTPVEMIDQVKNDEDSRLVTVPSAGLEFIAFNTRKAPFDDVNVRRAIASAINVAAMQENIVKDYGDPTNWILIPENMFTFEKAAWDDYVANRAPKYEYNLDEAKKYLAASSVPDGFDCTITLDSRSIAESVALSIQQALKELNINVEINKISYDEWIGLYMGENIADGVRPYDLFLGQWFSDFPDPSGDLTPILSSTGYGEGGSNTSGFSNKTVDELCAKQAASSDDAERADLMFQILDIVGDEMPYYVWCHPNYLFGASEEFADSLNFGPFYVWNFSVAGVRSK